MEKAKEKIKENKWRIFFVLGLLPFLTVLITGIYYSIVGIPFIGDELNCGTEGFLAFLIGFSFTYWPSYIIGAILMIVSIIKLKNQKLIRNARVFGLMIGILLIILGFIYCWNMVVFNMKNIS